MEAGVLGDKRALFEIFSEIKMYTKRDLGGHASSEAAVEKYIQLHPTPHTLHPTPFTLHHTPYTLHPTPYTLQPAPYILNPKAYIQSPEPATPNPRPEIRLVALWTKMIVSDGEHAAAVAGLTLNHEL